MTKKKKSKSIYKPRPISGFPEWLPNVRAIEQQWFDHIRRIFESYGYCNIETPSVEELAVIEAKGEDVDKEVYVLERLQKDEDSDKEARLALHFDQTVPLARYTAQHYNDLVFPFKRYQIQRVWRGERPQAGRFREFYQCDIDVISIDNLSVHWDAEMPAVIYEVLSSLPGMKGQDFQIRVSNRKILMGLLDALGIENVANKVAVTRIIDKVTKIKPDVFLSELQELGLSDDAIKTLQSLLSLKSLKEIEKFPAFADNETLQEGYEELTTVMNALFHLPDGAVVADLSIVRGLDYYTGTVYETVFTENPDYGSICSGGRYDDLAGSYINKHLPGVGISIGFSRLFSYLHDKGALPKGALSPADVLVIMPPNAENQLLARETARILRGRGFNAELLNAGKTKKQFAYAQKKRIPFIWEIPREGESEHTVIDIRDTENWVKTKTKPQDWVKNEI